jgi:hypothetical protein
MNHALLRPMPIGSHAHTIRRQINKSEFDKCFDDQPWLSRHDQQEPCRLTLVNKACSKGDLEQPELSRGT